MIEMIFVNFRATFDSRSSEEGKIVLLFDLSLFLFGCLSRSFFIPCVGYISFSLSFIFIFCFYFSYSGQSCIVNDLFPKLSD